MDSAVRDRKRAAAAVTEEQAKKVEAGAGAEEEEEEQEGKRKRRCTAGETAEVVQGTEKREIKETRASARE